jgi:hypothetical protein
MPTDPTGPFAGAARLYLASGWPSVLPLPARRKVSPPDGFTGRRGADPTQEQIQEWVRRRPRGNVALRLPEGVVGLDLDLYKPEGAASYAALVAECGPLPATWRSTSRDDDSGIHLFAVPARVRWAEGRAGKGIELVHRGHRYMVVWPSIHPEGRVYRWHPPGGPPSGRVPHPDELPALPAAWGRRLSEPPAQTQEAGVRGGRRRPAPAPYAQPGHGGGYAAASLAGAIAELATMGEGAGRNNALNRKAFHLGGFIAAGHLDPAVVRRELYRAAQANGHVAKHGERQTMATIDSGLRAGATRPRRTA